MLTLVSSSLGMYSVLNPSSLTQLVSPQKLNLLGLLYLTIASLPLGLRPLTVSSRLSTFFDFCY